MPSQFPHIRQALTSTPWAILPERFSDVLAVIERRMSGTRLSPDEIASIKGPRETVNGVLRRFGLVQGSVLAFDEDDEAAQRIPVTPAPLYDAKSGTSSGSGNAVAVINVHGIIAQHARQVDDVSGPGGTSTTRVKQALATALADPTVGSVVLNIDSPGGNVMGVQELGDFIYSSRGDKPIVAVANSMACSAAYWIASQCDEIVVAPGGQIGNIGVYMVHEDDSVLHEKIGVKFTFISAGKYKVEGNATEPLGDEARAAFQSDVDAYYHDFTSAVARGRGVKQKDVIEGFGEGRPVKDREAVRAGIADRVATLDDTLRRMLSGGKTRRQAKAARAEGLLFRVEGGDTPNPKILLSGDRFPEFLDISMGMDVGLPEHHMDWEGEPYELGSKRTFTFANAEGSYEMVDVTDHFYRFHLLDAYYPAGSQEDPAEPAEPTTKDPDSFRRRRHQNRLRRLGG